MLQATGAPTRTVPFASFTVAVKLCVTPDAPAAAAPMSLLVTVVAVTPAVVFPPVSVTVETAKSETQFTVAESSVPVAMSARTVSDVPVVPLSV